MKISKKLPECTKIKMSLAHLGKKRVPFSDETKRKMSIAKKGKHPNNFGKKLTIEQRKKFSSIRKGKQCHLWKGGIAKYNKSERQLAMQTIEYKIWREAVFKRDKWTCVLCNKKGVKLNADHIKSWALFPKLRFAIDNGRTLCVLCHQKTDNFGGNSLKFNTQK